MPLVDDQELLRAGAQVIYQRAILIQRELQVRFPDLFPSADVRPPLRTILSEKAKSLWADPAYRARQMKARHKKKPKSPKV